MNSMVIRFASQIIYVSIANQSLAIYRIYNIHVHVDLAAILHLMNTMSWAKDNFCIGKAPKSTYNTIMYIKSYHI